MSDLTHDELLRLYGPFAPTTPRDAADLFDGYPGRWWIAGGWAIEAFAGVHRAHGDLDPSVPRHELPLLRRHLAGRIDVWAADQERLQVLLPDDIGRDAIPDTCENVWARPCGAEPWRFDIILMPLDGDLWRFKRDARVTRPVSDLTWTSDGVPYLRPEIQLLHKAKGLRPRDRADFDAAAPLLDAGDRRWLRDALILAHPGHPWIVALG